MSGSPSDEWAFLGRRVAFVSPLPPLQDGIARYAGQLVDVLNDRELVLLGTREGSGGDRVIALKGGLNAFRLLWHARGYDDILVMYHPHYFHRVENSRLNRIFSYASWCAVATLRGMTVLVHERDETRPSEIGRRGRIGFWLEEAVRRAFWRRAKSCVFHTDHERRTFADRFPPGRRCDRLVTHGSFFATSVEDDRAAARTRLGLPKDIVVLLCIGFFSPENPDKGYDRAIAAVREADLPGVELHIVGSPIRTGPAVDRHVMELRRSAAESPNIHLHEGFVSDDEFDLWVRAADAVLTPYRESSSSSVVARTHLLGTTLITSGAGGMAEQLGPNDITFSNDAEFVEAIRSVAARSGYHE